MKLHSVVDTITNSSSVEFMIPNPNGVISKEKFKSMLANALIDDFQSGDQYATRILLDYLDEGSNIWRNYEKSLWAKETANFYTQQEIAVAALDWVEDEISITWTEYSILCHTHETLLPPRVENLITELNGTWTLN